MGTASEPGGTPPCGSAGSRSLLPYSLRPEVKGEGQRSGHEDPLEKAEIEYSTRAARYLVLVVEEFGELWNGAGGEFGIVLVVDEMNDG